MLTIIIPATSKALTTVGAVLAEIPGAHDMLIAEMILRASATAETYCGRSFALERVSQASQRTLVRGDSLPLLRYPVTEIHAVTANGEAVDPDAYGLEHGVLSGLSGRLVVDYSAGYILPGEEGRTLPHDIERVVIELVKNDWHTRARDTSIRSENVDGLSSLAFFGSGSTLNALVAPLAAYRTPVAL